MKQLFILLLCMSLLHPVCASTDGDTPFDATPSSSKTRYEPLEIELVDVTAEPTATARSWYKSKRFWCGAAAITAGIAVVSGITYAITKATMGECNTDHPFSESPTMSPMPSFVQNITDSASETCSSTLSSLASATSSWTNSISKTLSAAASESMSALESLTSSVTRTVTSTFSPSASFPWNITRLCRLPNIYVDLEYNNNYPACTYSNLAACCYTRDGSIPGCGKDEGTCLLNYYPHRCVTFPFAPTKWMCNPQDISFPPGAIFQCTMITAGTCL